MNSITIILTVALRKELPSSIPKHIVLTTRKALYAGDTKAIQNASIICIVTGVGKKASEDTIQWCIANTSPWCIINLGTAGTTTSQLLHKITCAQIYKYGNDQVPTLGLLPWHTPLNIHTIPIGISVTRSEPIQGDSIDMEAFWQAKLCHEHNITFTSIKYITDQHNDNTEKDFLTSLPTVQKEYDKLLHSLNPKLSSPQVSVIIPTYNRPSQTQAAITSVLNQTINCECIIVNDGSTDNTISELSLTKQCKLLNLPHNKGVSFARNYGASHATTPWISFLDSDDIWHPTKLESQFQYLQIHPYLNIIQSEEKWIRNQKPLAKKNYHKKQGGYIWEMGLERCMISPSSVLIKRHVFESFKGFDPTLPACEDYDLWLALSRHYFIGLDPSVTLTKYGGHSDQLSKKPYLDLYRIQGLLKAIQRETHPYFSHQLHHILNQKIGILSSGCHKHNNIKTEKALSKILDNYNLKLPQKTPND